MQRAKYNRERLQLYEQLFDRFVASEHSETVAANLLAINRWDEVSRAFTNCIILRSVAGPIRPLADDYGHLVAQAAELAFGTRTHAQIPSWFLQNNECFLASCLHKLLVAFERKAVAPLHMHRAFAALFDVADGLKPFLGLDFLARSTGAHALMCAAAHSRYDFLTRQEADASAASLCFAEMLAERILEGEAFGGDESALAFFARSARWQAFAKARTGCFSDGASFARLEQRVQARLAPKARESGLFFLASTFLETDVADSDALPSAPGKPRRSPIRKRSAPFVRLVRRLLSEA